MIWVFFCSYLFPDFMLDVQLMLFFCNINKIPNIGPFIAIAKKKLIRTFPLHVSCTCDRSSGSLGARKKIRGRFLKDFGTCSGVAQPDRCVGTCSTGLRGKWKACFRADPQRRSAAAQLLQLRAPRTRSITCNHFSL